MKLAHRTLALLLLTTGAFAEPAAPVQPKAIAERFGAEIAQAFNGRDQDALARMIDLRALATRAADYQGLTGPDQREFVRGAEAAGVDQIIAAYFKALDTSRGSVRFIRATNQFPPRSLVRFDMGAQGFNYCEFVLATDAAGRTTAVDWYQLATGDLMSVTLGGVSQMFSANNPGLVERLLGARPDVSTSTQLRRLGELQRAGKYDEALEVLKNLPEPLASARVILAMRASMAMFAKRIDEYDHALALMAKRHSGDPGVSFLLIDYYFKRQDTAQVLKAIDTMEKRIGVDGVTRQLRGNAYFLSNDLANALRYADESIALEPDRLESHDLRATFLVHLARYADAVAEYRAMEKSFGLRFTRDIFTSEPAFSGFAKSKEFAAWLPGKARTD